MRLVNCERILNHGDQKLYPYELLLLDKADLPRIMDLQDRVISTMDRNDYCVPLSAAEYLEILTGHGEALGLLIGGCLVAVCAILFPGEDQNNMARELNFSAEKLLQTAQLEIALIHPDFQGNGLQQMMAGLLVERAQSSKRCRYLFTTVSPYNYPSLQTVTALGMYLAKVCKKYFQWDRYVAYRDFLQPIELDKENALAISNADLEEQQALIAGGYLGFALLKGEQDIKVLFAKRIANS
ncbi:MAG: hypothetical protein RBT41_04720 [Clostridia bacterium]|nr:hypothetical protein [Clostridia bacterium]